MNISYKGDEILRLSRLVFKIRCGTDRLTNDRRDDRCIRLLHLQRASVTIDGLKRMRWPLRVLVVSFSSVYDATRSDRQTDGQIPDRLHYADYYAASVINNRTNS